jgi:hypothetical protein
LDAVTHTDRRKLIQKPQIRADKPQKRLRRHLVDVTTQGETAQFQKISIGMQGTAILLQINSLSHAD